MIAQNLLSFQAGAGFCVQRGYWYHQQIDEKRIFFEEFTMSLTYSRNKRGPRTEPWGTPHCVLKLTETKLPTAVVCLRSNKYERNQSFTIPRIP